MNNNQENLNTENTPKIKSNAGWKKLFSRIKCGSMSFWKSPFKATIVLSYVVCVMILWFQRGLLANNLHKHSIWYIIAKISPEAYQKIFDYGIPIVAILIFLLLMGLFGIPFTLVGKKFIYDRKIEKACTSAGIKTCNGKVPHLISITTDKHIPIITICEIHLNGKTKADFDAKKGNLQSELGVKIINFKEEGMQKLLMYIAPDNTKPSKKKLFDKTF